MTADRLTDADLDAIEDRANSATPGPWHHHAASSQAGSWDFTVDAEDPEFGEWFTVAFTEAVEGGDNNGRFIAHARTDVPALLAEVRRLREGIRELIDWAGPALAESGIPDRDMAETEGRWAALLDADSEPGR